MPPKAAKGTKQWSTGFGGYSLPPKEMAAVARAERAHSPQTLVLNETMEVKGKKGGWTEGMGSDAGDHEVDDLVAEFGSGFRTPPAQKPRQGSFVLSPIGSHHHHKRKGRRRSMNSNGSRRSWARGISTSFRVNMSSWNNRLFSPFRHGRVHPWKSITKAMRPLLYLNKVCGCKCGPSEEWFDKNPRQGVLFMTFVYALPIGAAVLVVMATEATIASKGLLLIASFSAVRDTTSAVGGFFSFFWYFEMSSVGKLVAEDNWKAVGGHMALMTLASLVGGISAGLALFFSAEPLLGFVSPPDDKDAILSVALTPTRIAAASVPFAVYSFGAAGLLLGSKVIAKTVCTFFFWGVGAALAIILALVKLDCTGEERAQCSAGIVAQLESGALRSDACELTYDDDGFVCTSYQGFLSTAAGVLAFANLGVATTFLILHFNLIRPHHVWLCGAMRSKEVLSDWSRDTSWVAVRSVFGNSRHFIALATALRIGIAESSAFIMFGSISQLAYAIPSNLASVAMITISRLIGRGDYKSADKVLDDYRSFGLGCGLLFCTIAAFSKDGLIASYTKEEEEQALRDVISPLWWWVLAYQPARSLLAVYQALIAGSQAFAYWAKATVIATLATFVPAVVLAAHCQQVEMLIIGEVLYTYVLFGLLYVKIHWLKNAHRGTDADDDVIEDLEEDEYYQRGIYAPDYCKDQGSDADGSEEEGDLEQQTSAKKHAPLQKLLRPASPDASSSSSSTASLDAPSPPSALASRGRAPPARKGSTDSI